MNRLLWVAQYIGQPFPDRPCILRRARGGNSGTLIALSAENFIRQKPAAGVVKQPVYSALRRPDIARRIEKVLDQPVVRVRCAYF